MHLPPISYVGSFFSLGCASQLRGSSMHLDSPGEWLVVGVGPCIPAYGLGMPPPFRTVLLRNGACTSLLRRKWLSFLLGCASQLRGSGMHLGSPGKCLVVGVGPCIPAYGSGVPPPSSEVLVGGIPAYGSGPFLGGHTLAGSHCFR